MKSTEKKGPNSRQKDKQRKKRASRKESLRSLESIEDQIFSTPSQNKLSDSEPSRRGKGLTWTFQENQKYSQFLVKHSDLFSFSDRERKEMGFHIEMSSFMGSRTPKQCRSHHQKMFRKFNTVDEIIRGIQKECEKRGKGKGKEEKETRHELLSYHDYDRRQSEESIWQQALNSTAKPPPEPQPSDSPRSSSFEEEVQQYEV